MEKVISILGEASFKSIAHLKYATEIRFRTMMTFVILGVIPTIVDCSSKALLPLPH